MLEHGHLHMPIPEAMIPYLIIVWNCLFFFLLRKLSLRIFPVKIHLFVQELISTIELCADCSELGEHNLKFVCVRILFTRSK